MFVVGLTGGIGSGKSEVAKLFETLGVSVVDVDVISHQLTANNHPILAEIYTALGSQFKRADGSLDRAALREKIFQDPKAKATLESILHPAIFSEALTALEINSKQNKALAYQVLVVPLLFESNRYRPIVDRILVIDCPEDKQISRVMARSQMTEAQVKAIIQQQTPRMQRIQNADDVILNNSDLANLREKINEYNKKILIYLHS